MIFLQIEKATESFLNQGLTGAVAVIFLIALIFIFKKWEKEKDKRIAELLERLSLKKEENDQWHSDYLATVHTQVENSVKLMERFIEVVASLKSFIEMAVTHEGNNKNNKS